MGSDEGIYVGWRAVAEVVRMADLWGTLVQGGGREGRGGGQNGGQNEAATWGEYRGVPKFSFSGEDA